MPLRDTSLKVRSGTAALTSSASGSTVEIVNTPLHGLALQVNCPTTPTGTSPQLVVYIHASTSTACTTASQLIAQSATITAAGEYIIPFVAVEGRSVMAKFDTAGTSPSFGLVSAYIVKNVGNKAWDRNIYAY